MRSPHGEPWRVFITVSPRQHPRGLWLVCEVEAGGLLVPLYQFAQRAKALECETELHAIAHAVGFTQWSASA